MPLICAMAPERCASDSRLPEFSRTIGPFTQALSRRTTESYTLGAISCQTQPINGLLLVRWPCGKRSWRGAKFGKVRQGEILSFATARTRTAIPSSCPTAEVPKVVT